MKKIIYTILFLLTSLSSFSQTDPWKGVGNALMRDQNGTGNYFRFNTSPGFMYLYTTSQTDALLETKPNTALVVLKSDTASMLNNVLHKALNETATGNKTWTGNTEFNGTVGLNSQTVVGGDGNLLFDFGRSSSYFYSDDIGSVNIRNDNNGLVIQNNNVAGGAIFIRSNDMFDNNGLYFFKGAVGTIPALDANVVHKTGNETISGNKTWTGKSIFSKTTFQDTVLFNSLQNSIANTDNRIVTYSPGHSNLAGYVDLSALALDANVIHKTGAETVGGDKTFANTVNFPTGRWDFAGIAVSLIRGLTIGSPLYIMGRGESPQVYSTIFQSALNPSNGTENRFRSGGIKAMIALKDTLQIADNILQDYSSELFSGVINNTGGNVNNRYSGIRDSVTLINAPNFSFLRSYRNLGNGYFINSLGTAPSLFNGDIEIGGGTYGLVLDAPNKNRYRITINNAGALVITSL